MKMMRTFFTILLIITYFSSYSQTLNDEEKLLYDLIMEYREEKGLPKIPLSPSLTLVAQTHVKDLVINRPNDDINCNMHSWSSKGSWSACCYTRNHSKASCMWNKPRELTKYKGNGYEIAHWSSAGASAESAIFGWKESPGHNAVIINEGKWSEQWNAIGIAIYMEYAVIWFGHEVDNN